MRASVAAMMRISRMSTSEMSTSGRMRVPANSLPCVRRRSKRAS